MTQKETKPTPAPQKSRPSTTPYYVLTLICLLIILIATFFVILPEYRGRKLVSAVEKSNVEEVRKLISKRIFINNTNLNNKTALYWAIIRNNTEIVRLLIEKGADVNEKDMFGMLDMHNDTPLQHAAGEGNIAIVRLLLASGANINPRYGFPLDITPIHKAAQNGHTEIVELFVNKGIDVNSKDYHHRTPLHEAADRGHAQTAKLLIAKGADVNAETDKGRTPLHEAAGEGHAAVVELLIKEAAIINTNDNENITPLYYALSRYHTEKAIKAKISMLLISNGADVSRDVNLQDNYGYTLIHHAARAGLTELVKLFIEKGADINAKTIHGDTPLDSALSGKHYDLAILLRKLGAR